MPRDRRPPALFAAQRFLADRAALLDWLAAPPTRARTVWYVNPFTLALAERGALPLRAGDAFVADGNMISRVLARIAGRPCESLNVDFSGCADEVFAFAQARAMPVALIGGRPGEPQAVRRLLRARYPELRIVFVHDGYFGPDRTPAVIRGMVGAGAELAVVSMGSPRQEAFCAAVATARRTPAKLITSGAFISQLAERGYDYYPAPVLRWRVRWLYRLVRDRRIALRVLRYYIPFLLRWRLRGRSSPLLDA